MTTRLTSVCGQSAARHFQLICFRIPLVPPRRSRRGEVGFRGEVLPTPSPAASSPLSVPRVHLLATGFRRSFLGSARSRDPASRRARLRGVTSGLSASGPPLARVLVSVPGAGGSGGAVRGPCSGGVRFSGGQRRVSAGQAGGQVPVRFVAGQALGSVPAAAAAICGRPQHSFPGETARAPPVAPGAGTARGPRRGGEADLALGSRSSDLA